MLTGKMLIGIGVVCAVILVIVLAMIRREAAVMRKEQADRQESLL